MQTLDQFMPDVFSCSLQTLKTLVGIGFITFHVYPNLRRTPIFRDVDRCHTDQTDPWISQLSFNQRFNFLAESFTDPPAMIFEPTLFHDLPPQVKLMRIAQKRL